MNKLSHTQEHILNQLRSIISISFLNKSTMHHNNHKAYQLSMIALVEGLILFFLLNYFILQIPQSVLDQYEIHTIKLTWPYYCLMVFLSYIAIWIGQFSIYILFVKNIYKIPKYSLQGAIAFNWTFPVYYTILLLPSLLFLFPSLVNLASSLMALAYFIVWVIRWKVMYKILHLSIAKTSILIFFIFLSEIISRLVIQTFMFKLYAQ